MVRWVVAEAQVAPMVEAIIQGNRTGALGDVKIFVLPVEKSIPISAGRSDAEEQLTEWVMKVGRHVYLARAADRPGRRAWTPFVTSTAVPSRVSPQRSSATLRPRFSS